METLWFCLVALMITVYVLLDGFDLGAGIVHFCVGRNDAERGQVLGTIGPVWDGNEVWLLAGGGTLYFAFPAVYSAGFSGLYLPLMMVLWLLILRGAAIEFRSHVAGPVWRPFWDFVFTGASAVLAVFFGAAVGNVVRGMPLDAAGEFFLPLWTDFSPGPNPGVLDWYTVLVGLAAFLALARHGALWVALKTEDPVRERARRVASLAWYGVAGMTLVITGATFRVQPHVPERLSQQPWILILAAVALAGLLWGLLLERAGKDKAAFLASCAYLVGMLTTAAFSLYPYLLPSTSDPQFGLTVYNAATGAYGMRVALYWWIPGMVLVAVYMVLAYRRFAGKVQTGEEGY